MKLKIGLCVLNEDDEIEAKTTTQVTWDEEAVKDLEKMHDVDAEKELSGFLAHELKKLITPELIFSLIKEC